MEKSISNPVQRLFKTEKKIKTKLGGTEMKKYQTCEVKIRLFVAEDVIKTSQPFVNGVSTDTFANEEWWKEGGTVS